MEKTEKKNRLKKIEPQITAALVSCGLLLQELALKLSTDRTAGGMVFFYLLLFSLAGGAAAGMLLLFFPKFLRRILCGVLLFFTGALFTAEFFIFRAFKIFYDYDTVSAGAGGVLSQFTGDIARMVLCPDGIGHIVLFFLPFLVLIVLCGWERYGSRPEVPGTGKAEKIETVSSAQQGLDTGTAETVRKDPDADTAFRGRLWMICFTAVCTLYALTGKAAAADPVCGPVCGAEYSFQNAVCDFGLMTGLRMDLLRHLFPEQEGSGFDYAGVTPENGGAGTETPASEYGSASASDADPQAATASDATASDAASKAAEKPKVYGFNEMKIDFEALAAGTDNQELSELYRYCASLTPSRKNAFTGLFQGKNLIMITAEAFSSYVIDPVRTPTLYRLSEKGFRFTDYYQPASAGTTGGEFEHLFGLLPTAGGKSMRLFKDSNNYFTMGNQLNRLGYFGKAYHNNTDTFYDRNETHENLGYSEGFEAMGSGMERYVNADLWPESDAEMFRGTLNEYLDHQPFNIYYMTVSGHGIYEPLSANKMAEKHIAEMEGCTASDAVKNYLAANLDLEEAMTILVDILEERGIADDTVICLTADHFPYGLDKDAELGHLPNLSELYGTEVKDYLTRDQNRLILWCGSLEKEAPVTVDTPVSSLDILPTLSNLFGTEWDSRLLPGRDVFSDAEPIMFDLNYDWKTDKGTFLSNKGKFVQNDPEEVLPEGYVKRIRTIVQNKIQFCKAAVKNDFYTHVFGEKPEPAAEVQGTEAQK